MRFFNTGGPCNPLYHYMLSADQRLHEENVMRLIEQQAYFILHAPHQTGKTTAILELAQRLTASGRYIAVVVSLEVGAAFPQNVGAAEDAILSEWQLAIQYALPQPLQPRDWKPQADAGLQIGAFLSAWALTASRPLVIFFR